jgi:hypothetical protein
MSQKMNAFSHYLHDLQHTYETRWPGLVEPLATSKAVSRILEFRLKCVLPQGIQTLSTQLSRLLTEHYKKKRLAGLNPTCMVDSDRMHTSISKNIKG